ncbi:MAG: hypothetical protein RSG07_05235 [Erysipelotrichaceae bacterium]
MRIRLKSYKNKKVNDSSIPNILAFSFIKNFLTDKENEAIREEYLIGNLNKAQVTQLMSDMKWLFKNYKGLDVMTIEDSKGDVSKFIL